MTNLSIPEYEKCGPIAGNINDSITKSILKYRCHPSILAIGEVVTEEKNFKGNL